MPFRLRLSRLPKSNAARHAAESFLREAIERVEHSVLVSRTAETALETAIDRSLLVLETTHLVMTALVNYVMRGWTGPRSTLVEIFANATEKSIDFLMQHGVAERACPSSDEAADVLLGAFSMLSHAMGHILDKEHESRHLLEHCTAQTAFGIMIRAMHEGNKEMSFADFEPLAQSYFHDACELYRRELAAARSTSNPVH